HAHTTLLNALEELLNPPETVLLRGDEAEIASWATDLGKLYAPRRMVLAIPGDATGLPPALADKTPPTATQGAIAYVCRGSTCSMPITSLTGLVNRLRAGIDMGD